MSKPMPTFYTLICCLLIGFSVKAQDTAFLAADQVNVRFKPDVKSKVIAKLAIGTPVTVLSEIPDHVLTMRGHEAPWNEVSFEWEGKEQKGYLWGGFLSQHRAVLDSLDHLTLLTRPVAIKSNEYYDEVTYQIRLEQLGHELGRLEFEGIGSTRSFVGVDVFDGRGLPGVEHIFHFEYSDDVCGGAFGRVVIFWDGSDLHFVQRQQEGADAPVWSEQYFIYPADEQGQQNTLIQVYAFGDEDHDGNEITERTETSFTWNGQKLIKQ